MKDSVMGDENNIFLAFYNLYSFTTNDELNSARCSFQKAVGILLGEKKLFTYQIRRFKKVSDIKTPVNRVAKVMFSIMYVCVCLFIWGPCTEPWP